MRHVTNIIFISTVLLILLGSSLKLCGATSHRAAAGWYHSLFIDNNGTLWAMGDNSRGQLGDGTTTSRSTPVYVASNVYTVAAGYFHSLFITNDRKLWAMGDNSNGRLGDGTTTNRDTPVLIATNVLAVAAGSGHSLFVTTDGKLWAMGWNGNGQLGDGTQIDRVIPVHIADTVFDIAPTGFRHSMFITYDSGRLLGMGFPTSYQFGDIDYGMMKEHVTPVEIASHVLAASTSSSHSLYVTSNNVLWSLGRNDYGQLGDGTTINRITPTQVASNVLAIAAGSGIDEHAGFSFFITYDLKLWAFGNNSYGQLGVGTAINSTVPIQVADSVIAVAAGYYHSIYITQDGKVWATGRNEAGQLGDGSKTDRNMPVQVVTGTTSVPVRAHTWINIEVASWDVATNWSDKMVPGGGNTIYINNSGTSSIGAGVIATSSLAYLGENTNDIGTAIIDGNGEWDTYNIFIGRSGTGALAISDNGSMRSQGGAYIGGYNTATGCGSAIICGNGLWNSGYLHIGERGSGSLLITGNSRLTSVDGIIALYEGCKGSVTIEGNGTWSTDKIVVGYNAGSSGTFVMNGGLLETKEFLSVSGTASVLFNSGTIRSKTHNNNFFQNISTVPLEAGGLIFDTDTAIIATNSILTGSGGLTKLGDGVLTLNATNTYTGITRVNGGKLQVVKSVASSIVNSATLTASSVSGMVTNNLGSTIVLNTNATAQFGGLVNNGLIDFNSTSIGPYHSITTGNLSGTGTMRLTINPAANNGDSIIVTGNSSGAQTLIFNVVGQEPEADVPPLDADIIQRLVTVKGTKNAIFTGSFAYGSFIYTLQQQPDGSIKSNPTNFAPNIVYKIEPALQTVVANSRVPRISLEAIELSGGNVQQPITWQWQSVGTSSWTTITETTATRIWLENVSSAMDGRNYRFTTGGTSSLSSMLRVIYNHTPSPADMVFVSSTLYLINADNSFIQKITPAGAISTFAGMNDDYGTTDATGTAARFNFPAGVTVAGGALIVSDMDNHTIRRVDLATSAVTTLAGYAGRDGSSDGLGNAARFRSPSGIAATPDGSYVYVSDMENHTIRRVGLSNGNVSTIAGVAGQYGATDGTGTSARFSFPCGIAMASTGELYVADVGNRAVRKITQTGVVTTLGAATPGGTTFISPYGVAIDDINKLLYISDEETHAIYVSDIGNGSNGGGRIFTILAGRQRDADMRDGSGTSARFSTPWGMAVSANGELYVADNGNSALRKIDNNGLVTTLILTATTEPGTSGTNGGSGNGGSDNGGNNSDDAGGGGGGGASSLWYFSIVAALLCVTGYRKKK